MRSATSSGWTKSLKLSPVSSARVVNSEHPRVRGVDLEVGAVQVDERHSDRRVLKTAAEALLTRAKRLLDPFALGDVGDVATDAHYATADEEGRGARV